MTHAAPKGAGITDFTNEGMKGKTIGAQSGTTQADYAAAVYPDSDIKLYPTQDEVNLDMVNGRLDVQVGDMIPLRLFSAVHRLALEREAPEVACPSGGLPERLAEQLALDGERA